MKRVVENGRHYVIRQGKRIEVVPVEMPEAPKRREPFKAEFVKFPTSWCEALRRGKCGPAYELALVILSEAYKRKHVGGEIVLSAEVTGMTRTSRRTGLRKLVELGLIKLHRTSGNQAYRVSIISY
jgi:hypothetical protein